MAMALAVWSERRRPNVRRGKTVEDVVWERRFSGDGRRGLV
jgi:hypothetical protein